MGQYDLSDRELYDEREDDDPRLLHIDADDWKVAEMRNVEMERDQSAKIETPAQTAILALIAEAREIERINDMKAAEEERLKLREQEQRAVKAFTSKIESRLLEALGEVTAQERDTWSRLVTLQFSAGNHDISARLQDCFYYLDGSNGRHTSFEDVASPSEYTQGLLLALGNIIAPAAPVPDDDIPF
jgi:hypothetical protein